jgi:NAD(P)H-dependent flavin oxidoreductase YrpB (nitropropane dioxygenase family)
LGIDHLIFGFTHDIATVAAITNAGDYGVCGATRRVSDEIREKLALIRSLVGEKPFGADLVLPPGMPEHNSRKAIEAEISEEHKKFVARLIEKYQVLPASGPGMLTLFIPSSDIEEAQVQAVLESSVNIFACGIGAPSEVLRRAKVLGKTNLALIGSRHHVQRALADGADTLVAQGYGYDARAHAGPIGTYFPGAANC